MFKHPSIFSMANPKARKKSTNHVYLIDVWRMEYRQFNCLANIGRSLGLHRRMVSNAVKMPTLLQGAYYIFPEEAMADEFVDYLKKGGTFIAPIIRSGEILLYNSLTSQGPYAAVDNIEKLHRMLEDDGLLLDLNILRAQISRNGRYWYRPDRFRLTGTDLIISVEYHEDPLVWPTKRARNVMLSS